MKSPPTLNDIEAALLALRQPAERRLLQIQDLRDRFLESHRHSTAVVDPVFVEQSKRLRRSVREHRRGLDRLPLSAFRTLVVCDPDTERLTAIALVPEETETPALRIGEWEVACVGCTFHLLRCQVGDVIPQGLVVSVNGSPVLADSQRRRKLEALRAPPLPPREQKRRERLARGVKRDRFIAERLRREDALQEVFFQNRKAVEEREKRLREKLRRTLQGPSAPAPADLIDDSAALPKRWESADSPRPADAANAREAAREEPAEESIVYVTDPNAPELPLRPADPPARPLDMGWVLAAFGLGCIAGLFVAPRAFSLVGALCAALAALALRLRARC